MTTLAAQVRKILRETHADLGYGMWTNKYKKCRTVKCYASNDDEQIIDAAEQIEEFCTANNIKFDMKVRARPGYTRAIIVRLPLEV